MVSFGIQLMTNKERKAQNRTVSIASDEAKVSFCLRTGDGVLLVAIAALDMSSRVHAFFFFD